MAASTVTLPCFKLNHQPNYLLRCNHSSNQTLLRFHFSLPKPLLISTRNSSRRFKVLPETITVKWEEEEKEEDTKTVDLDPSASINTKLYFGNLPYNVDSATLAQIIQDFANPELVEVLYNRDTGQSRGFAFVTMSSVEDCNIIIENLDGTEYLGRTLKVNFADKPKPNKEPLYPETEHKHLPCQTTVQPPRRGRPNRVAIIYSAETPKSIVAVNHTQIARSLFINQG